MAQYTGAKLKNEINIGKLYSVHYFEYPVNFSFCGEKHNFWEFVYADKGNVTVFAGKESFVLKQGEGVFHKPNEWHNISAPDDIAPNVFIVSFECESPAMKFFENKILSVGQEQKLLISKIMSEYTASFSTPLDNPYTKSLTRKKEQRFGAEQLIRQYIAEFLISYLRHENSPVQRSVLNLNRDNQLLNLLETYMIDHIKEKITIDDLVRYSGTNKTTVTAIFKNNLDLAPIEYFILLKVSAAKQYLRENNYNISQIAEILGYANVHYFSRQFKKTTGMTPSEYSLSIQSVMKPL